MVSQRTTIATNRSSFVPSFAHFFFFFFSFFFFTVFAAEQGIKGLQRLQSEERIRAYARTHTFNTVLKQQEQQQERDERRTRKLLGGGAEYPDIQSPSILTESNFCGIYSELIQCSQYSNANDCNADNRCNFEGSACDIKIGELPGLWLVNAAIAVASVCADAVDAGTCQARVSYGCTWSVNSSSCDLYEVETGLTTLTGDAFLAAIVTVGLFTCGSQSLQTDQTTCEANNYCLWTDPPGSCGPKSNFAELAYPSYCDASTAPLLRQSPGQCNSLICPAILSESACDANAPGCLWSYSAWSNSSACGVEPISDTIFTMSTVLPQTSIASTVTKCKKLGEESTTDACSNESNSCTVLPATYGGINRCFPSASRFASFQPEVAALLEAKYYCSGILDQTACVNDVKCSWNVFECLINQNLNLTCFSSIPSSPPPSLPPSPPPSLPPSSSSRIEEVGLKTLAFAIVFILANVLIV